MRLKLVFTSATPANGNFVQLQLLISSAFSVSFHGCFHRGREETTTAEATSCGCSCCSLAAQELPPSAQSKTAIHTVGSAP
jgi:hypothetical protein